MFHKELALLLIVTSLVAFAFYAAEAQQQPLAIVSKGLVSYWTLDEIKKGAKGTEIVEDIVGENDGIVNEQGSNPKPVEGKYGNALRFDGIQDFIRLGTKKLPTGNSGMTISAWIFKGKKGHPAGHHVVCFGVWDCCGTGFSVSTFVGQRRLNNRLSMGQWGGDFGLNGPEIALGEWHHVAAVYDGAKKNLLYLDGVEVGAKELEKEPDVNLGPIGGKGGEGAVIGTDTRLDSIMFFEGVIDEVGIYNRGLTPDEVRRNATSPQIFAVEPAGKLSLTWAKIKTSR